MFLKKPSLTLPSMAGYQQRLRKGNLMTRNKSVTRSSLNLPALIKHKKLNYCDKEDDISLMFQKLSALYCYLKDPLKELLLQCAFEDQEKCYKLFYFDPFTMDQELPREASCSPQPDHMTPIKRSISNKVAAQHKVFGVYRQDAPLPTVIARWTPKSMSTQYDLQSAIQELSRFGDIDSITPFGRQSVIVIFKDIRSACKAVNAFAPDGPNRSMRCFWHHNFMSKYRRAATFAKTIAPVH